MPGAPLQVVSVSNEDIWLIGNPQITFFKSVYKRYTNFAIESIPLPFLTGQENIGGKFTIELEPYGDLIGRCILEITILDTTPNDLNPPETAFNWNTESNIVLLPPNDVYLNRLGTKLIEKIEFQIDRNTVDTQWGRFMDIRSQFEIDATMAERLNRLTSAELDDANYIAGSNKRRRKIYLPLQFWFNRNPGNYLPLVAIQSVKCQLLFYLNNIKLNFFYPKLTEDNPILHNLTIDNIQFYADYIFLDNDERLKFTHETLEYLVEQVQNSEHIPLNPDGNGYANIITEIKQPTKSIIFTVQKAEELKKVISYNYFEDNGNPLFDIKPVYPVITSELVLNTEARFIEQDYIYNSVVKQYELGYGIGWGRNPYYPTLSETLYFQVARELGGYYVYHFAIDPRNSIQPSGSANMSKLKNQVLRVKLRNPDIQKYIQIWAVNWNIFKVENGAAGVIFLY